MHLSVKPRSEKQAEKRIRKWRRTFKTNRIADRRALKPLKTISEERQLIFFKNYLYSYIKYLQDNCTPTVVGQAVIALMNFMRMWVSSVIYLLSFLVSFTIKSEFVGLAFFFKEIRNIFLELLKIGERTLRTIFTVKNWTQYLFLLLYFILSINFLLRWIT